MHLGSIIEMIEKGDGTNLNQISHYIEALSVNKGSITDRYWTFDEDKLTFSVWSMLAYLFHAQTFFKDQEDLLKLINSKLLDGLQKALPIFKRIYERELLQEKIYYLKIKKIELLFEELYKIENPSIDFPMLNFPQSDMISLVEKRKAFSLKDKVTLLESTWKDGYKEKEAMLIDEIVQEVFWETKELSWDEKIAFAENLIHEYDSDVMRSEKIKKINSQIETFEGELLKIKVYFSQAQINETKRVLQSLCQYEYLKIVSEVTGQLSTSDAAPEAYEQWLVILREALKTMLEDVSLNIPSTKSLSKYSDFIKILRDYYEHPEDYVLTLERSDEKGKISELKKLEINLFQDLKALGKDIKSLIDVRLKKMDRILSPKRKSPEDIFNTLKRRDDPKETEALKAIKEDVTARYPGISDFISRIKPKRELFGSKISARRLHVPLPFDITADDILDLLKSSLAKLQSDVHFLSRTALKEKLDSDLSFRFVIQRQISSATRLLEKYVHKQKHYLEYNHPYQLIEQIYLEARSTRNFQTHDLWRQDSEGVIDTIYLLAYDCRLILSDYMESKPYKSGSDEHKIILSIIHRELDETAATYAIEKHS